jgi:hypothetical protein
MVLSDGLAARLSEDLGAADTLDKELVDAEDELAAAKEVMRLYEPVARRGAVLMQVATKLIQVRRHNLCFDSSMHSAAKPTVHGPSSRMSTEQFKNKTPLHTPTLSRFSAHDLFTPPHALGRSRPFVPLAPQRCWKQSKRA